MPPAAQNPQHAPVEDVRNGRKALLASPDNGLWETARRFWRKSYAGDYLGLLIIAVLFLFVEQLWDPFHQMFVLQDLRIQHPWAQKERVDVYWLMIYSTVLPLLTILLWTLARPPRHGGPDTHKAHVSVLGLAISVLLTALLTDIIKNFVGRPRPDLLDRCSPAAGTHLDEWVTIDVCTETEQHKLHDGFRSFPSGHSSVSFAGLGWLALFLAAQTHCLRARANLVLVLFCLAPMVGAALIAISRLEDYRHDVGDVMVGGILGSVVTYLNWRRYYPSLLNKWCDEPYEPVEKGGVSGYQWAGRDEEEMIGLEGDEEDGAGRPSRSGSR